MALRIDLDDLPPKVAAQLTGVATGDEVLLVQNGVVVTRLTAVTAESQPLAEPEPPLAPEETAKEIFEQFRSAIEDEF
jgi:antitoxin (DNA-binding transcriptional repressor) of toxin-antitoxin stability system